MKFQPKTDEELAEENLLPEGEYSFEISGAEDTVSKSSGLDMIVLTVRVYKPDGNFNLITDYLSSSPKAAFKLSNICKACGIKDKYDAGELQSEDFIGKTGMLKLKVQKDASGQYADRNAVGSYVVPKDGDAKVEPPKDALSKVIDGDDNIPF